MRLSGTCPCYHSSSRISFGETALESLPWTLSRNISNMAVVKVKISVNENRTKMCIACHHSNSCMSHGL